MSSKTCAVCGSAFSQRKNEQYCSLKCAVLSRSNIRSHDDCWEWTGAIASNGYGVFSFLSVMYTAHRASYIAHHGDIPDREGSHGGVVMHQCDNRKCVNPNHLTVGSQKDNLQDANQKGRMKSGCARGELARTAILTADQVIEIRRRLEAGERGVILASFYGVTVSAISSIKQRKSWKHI